MKFAALIIAVTPIAERLANRVKNSFYYFHPDIPVYIFGYKEKELLPYLGDEIEKTDIGAHAGFLATRFVLHLLDKYDVVFRFGADTIVTARLDEFLNVDYDVAGSLNMERYPGDKFMNADVQSIASRKFAQEWVDITYNRKFCQEHDIGMAETGTFNYILASGRYRLKTVDEKSCYYNERSRPFWGFISVRDEKIFVNNRQIKVLHWAGGALLEKKLSWKLFSRETREFLNKVTGTTDFTDIEGDVFGGIANKEAI